MPFQRIKAGFNRMFKDPTPTTAQEWGPYAMRQRALAEGLQGRAMNPTRETGGAVRPVYGLGEGLSQLGMALLARRQGKKATEAESTAESERQKALAAALQGTPYEAAQAAADAGADPRVVAQMGRPVPQEKLVAIVGEDGRPQYVPESQAVGQSPWSGATQGLGAADLQLYDRYAQQAQAAGQQPMSLLDWKQAYSKASVGAQYGSPTDVPGVGVVQPSRVGESNITLSTEPDVSGARAARAAAETTARGEAETGVNLQRSAPAAYNSATAAVDNMRKFAEQAERVRSHRGLSSATGFGGETISGIPGTEAANAASEIEVLKSQSFVNALQAMRAASQTGGAVGAVSDSEGARFENAYVALQQSQTYEQYQENLQRLEQVASESVERIMNAYRTQYGGVEGAPSFATESSTPDFSQMSREELEAWIKANGN